MRLIVVSTELEGHAGAGCFIASSEKQYDQYMSELLYEGEMCYVRLISCKKNDDGSITRHFTDLRPDRTGFSVLTLKFTDIKELKNRDFFVMTG